MMNLLNYIVQGGKSLWPSFLSYAPASSEGSQYTYYSEDTMALPTLGPSLAEVHDLLKNTCPPSKRGAIEQRIFINKELSLLAPTNAYDEVYPGIFLGDKHLARDKKVLCDIGITHLVNAAEGNLFHQVDTRADFYAAENINYLGIRAQDTARFKMDQHFQTVSEYIAEALASGGKVAVHCVQGMSRSAAIVLAYLMLKQNMNLQEAIVTVRKKRAVFPNDGFLKQLIQLDQRLSASRPSEQTTR